MTLPLFLASGSPRRAALLRQIGLTFSITSADIDETWHPDEALESYVLRLARAKAEAAADDLPADSLVIAADTAGQCGDLRLLKPQNEADAINMLMQMSGRTHTVSTGVSVFHPGTQQHLDCVVNSTVLFRTLDTELCRRYWASGEPADKAGSYAIQGMGAIFVESLHGSYSGVVGLPLYETAHLLARAGLPVLPTGGSNT
jgi:septum formation protein